MKLRYRKIKYNDITYYVPVKLGNYTDDDGNCYNYQMDIDYCHHIPDCSKCIAEPKNIESRRVYQRLQKLRKIK